MSARSLHEHGKTLTEFAKSSEARAQMAPHDWLAELTAKNQRQSAVEVQLSAAQADAEESGEILEWRFMGRRLQHGELPLDFVAKLAAPLNNLLVRSAYFARNKVDAIYSASDDLSKEIGLSIVGIAPGSTRLLLRGSASPDTTGQSAFSEGVAGLFEVLSSTSSFEQFYDRLDDIGERAAEALHDTLKAVESEECAVEIRWHRMGHDSLVQATFDRVVQMRALLEGITDAQERRETLSGRISLLAVNGRIQLETDEGRRVSVRFKPRTQTMAVSDLTLNAPVKLEVSVRVTHDPIGGGEIKRYTLLTRHTPLLELPPLEEE